MSVSFNCFFFFKQKTAYEMRISDWSSDVCSSDLMDRYIAPLNRMSGRIKQRILAENGIKQRYYAIDETGKTRWTNAAQAAQAIRDCLRRQARSLAEEIGRAHV